MTSTNSTIVETGGWSTSDYLAAFQPSADAPEWSDPLTVAAGLLADDTAGTVLLSLARPDDEDRRTLALSPSDARRLAEELQRLATEAERPLVHTPHPGGRPRLAPDRRTAHTCTSTI